MLEDLLELVPLMGMDRRILLKLTFGVSLNSEVAVLTVSLKSGRHNVDPYISYIKRH